MNLAEENRPAARMLRKVTIAAISAMAIVLLIGVARLTFVDPDMFHGMSLFREALRLGRLPMEDSFAYTPTVVPVVHHEWATGAILYLITQNFGGPGILIFRYGLIALMAVLTVRCSRDTHVGWGVLIALLPVGIFMSWTGLTTIRAQVLSMLILAVLLWFLQADCKGARWWLVPWLVLFLLWVNLHAGFIAGAAVFVAYAIEQRLRGRPVAHLLLAAAIMAALVAVNPYGIGYYGYLWYAITLDRSLITEWAPIWESSLPLVTVYVVSLLVVGYALYRAGWRRVPGIILVLLVAYAAMRHQRHLSLYAIAWTCYVPAFVQPTPLGDWISKQWNRQGKWAFASWVGVCVVLAGFLLVNKPWRLPVPSSEDDRTLAALPLYPSGAVEYLRQCSFQGNLMTPFSAGAFVTWKLYPSVRVSMDGRYEVAYPPGALERHMSIYQAEPGWEAAIREHGTDAVLVSRDHPLAGALDGSDEWTRCYRDDAYEIHARPGLALPESDRRGQRIRGIFP